MIFYAKLGSVVSLASSCPTDPSTPYSTIQKIKPVCGDAWATRPLHVVYTCGFTQISFMVWIG